jgi:hypothetical protein
MWTPVHVSYSLKKHNPNYCALNKNELAQLLRKTFKSEPSTYKDIQHVSKLYILARMNNFLQKHMREGNRESEPTANAGALMVVVVHYRGTLCRIHFKDKSRVSETGVEAK